MKKLISLLITLFMICVIMPINLHADGYTLSGSVIDSSTGEKITDAAVIKFYLPDGGLNFQADIISGEYSIDLASGEYQYTIEESGYLTASGVINITGSKDDFDITLIKSTYINITESSGGLNASVSKTSADVPVGATYSTDGGNFIITYNGETFLTVTVTPNRDYRVAGWCNFADPISSGTIDDESYNFVADIQRLYLFVADGENGTLDNYDLVPYFPNDEVETSVDGNELTITFDNNDYSYNAIADDYYGLSHWSYEITEGTQVELPDSKTFEYSSFSSSAIYFRPVFERIYSYTVVLSGDSYETIEDADVELVDGDGNTYTATETYAGNYVIEGIFGGEYTLNIEKEGYAPYTEDISVNDDTEVGKIIKVGRTLTYSAKSPNGFTSDIASGSIVFPDTKVELSANIKDGYQLDYITCVGNVGDITIDGKDISFDMPSNDLTITGYFNKTIDSVNVDFNLPIIGSSTFDNPVIDKNAPYTISSVFVGDPSIVDIATTPYESGKQYFAYISLKAKDGYAFKYDGQITTATDCDENDYGVSVSFNDEPVIAYANPEEVLTKTGYYGTNSEEHNYINIVYFFAPVSEQEYTNKKITIQVGDEKELEFITTADYSVDSDVTVKVDGSLLDSSKYDLAHGSTHVILHSDYVSSLRVGTHTMTIGVKGYNPISQKFTVKSNKAPNGDYVTPNTSVTSFNGELLITTISSISLLTSAYYLKRKKNKEDK